MIDSTPQPQECIQCGDEFDPFEPMIETSDGWMFCSWRCIEEFVTQGNMSHCWTHDDLLDCYRSFNQRMTAIMAEDGKDEVLPPV